MPGDVSRLFSKINQSNLPYQVFEDTQVQPVSDAARLRDQASAMAEAIASMFECPATPDEDVREEIRIEPPVAELPNVRAVETGFLKAYAEPVEQVDATEPGGTRLADLFQRMKTARR